AIGIGAETKNGADDSVAIGRIAKCTKNTYGQIAIGSGAEAYGFESVQIGYGRNTANTSIQFHDWQLINSQGKIPNERMTGVTQNVTLADGTVLVIQNGLITSIQ
ncbi:MAG: hypothetical protein JXR97_05585, partial [Planctomycetes bacterium]|nr:hypothetical protein [Planctomycetota bacterium]